MACTNKEFNIYSGLSVVFNYLQYQIAYCQSLKKEKKLQQILYNMASISKNIKIVKSSAIVRICRQIEEKPYITNLKQTQLK